MIERRPFARLGFPDEGWLKSRHRFSFADYRDAARTRWASGNMNPRGCHSIEKKGGE